MEELTPAQKVRYLGSLLTSTGWTALIKPALVQTRDALLTQLIESGDAQKDVEIKAAIRLCNWVLGWEAKLDQFATELDDMVGDPRRARDIMFQRDV